jgi:hypothetical protein
VLFQPCALGAAAGAGIEPSKLEESVWFERMLALFPELNGRRVVSPVDGRKRAVRNVILDMNDRTDMPRQEIADWLCRASGCVHDMLPNS